MTREFKSIAEDYDQLRGPVASNIAVWINTICEYLNLKDANKLLDLGCGSGKFALPFAQHGLDVYGIDNSEAMLQAAKKRDKAEVVNWVQGDVTDLSFADDFFTACFQSMVIMHIDDKLKFFQEIKRVLKEDGLCFVRMASPEQIKQLDWYMFFPELLKKDLELCPTPEEVKEYMEQAGLTWIEKREVVEKNQTSPAKRLKQVKEKAFSGLRTLSEERYRSGLEQYEKYVANLNKPEQLEDNKLLLLIGKNE